MKKINGMLFGVILFSVQISLALNSALTKDSLTIGMSAEFENLNPLILPVCHPQKAFGIHRNPMRHLKFTWLSAGAAPGFYEVPVLVEFQNARIPAFFRVALNHKHVSVAAEGYRVRLIESMRTRSFIPLAGFSLLTKREQDLSF